MSLPESQRFKSGESARTLKWAVYDADGDLVDLTTMTSTAYKHRRHGVSSPTTISSGITEVAGPTTHSVAIDVSGLAPAFYKLEIDVDTGAGIASPEIEIEVYEDAG